MGGWNAAHINQHKPPSQPALQPRGIPSDVSDGVGSGGWGGDPQGSILDSTGNSQHPLDALLGAANEIDQAAAENEGLARQHSLFLAQSMSQKMADEEQEKKELVES